MITPVITHVPYYPLETADSYLRRLARANHMDPDLVRRALVQASWRVTETERREISVTRLEQVAGLPLGTITRADDSSTSVPPQRNCHHCAISDRTRWMCLQCAKGQRVQQVRHHQMTICLKHRRWTGPGTTPRQHVRVDHPDLIRAEGDFRQHHFGRCPTNVAAVTAITADWALHTNPGTVARRVDALPIGHLPDDLRATISTYPESVALMSLFDDSTWLHHTLQNTRSYNDIHRSVLDKVGAVIDEHPEHIAARVMREIKPAIARYFYTEGVYHRYRDYPENDPIPVWHHDVDITI